MNDYFHWDVERVLFQLGTLEIRYYGLLFAAGLLVSVHMIGRSFQDRGLPEKHARALSLILPIGMIIGAHLIHLIFYEPRSIIENPVRIPLTMGQLLSGPIALFCGYMALFSRRCGLLFPPKPSRKPTARHEDASTEATTRARGR